MKAEEVNAMSDAQLKNSLEENHQELFNLRFQIATRKIKNHQRISQVK
jgi:ribosomal protein L29